MIYLKERIVNSFFNMLIKSRSFETIEERDSFWLKKLKKKINFAFKKTPYWHDVFNKASDGDFKTYLNSINSLSDFKELVPQTFRKDLVDYGNKMIPESNHLIKITTSGTSGGAVTVFYAPVDFIHIVSAAKLLFDKAGVNQLDNIVMLFPAESNTAKGNKMNLLYPNLEVMLYSKDEGVTELMLNKIFKSDCLVSYAHIPFQLINNNQLLINDLMINGAVNLRVVMGSGDYMPESGNKIMKSIIPDLRVFNPLVANDFLGVSYVCKHGNIHINSGNYFPELIANSDGLNELIITSLFSKGSQLIRYHTGDLVELIDCSCGSIDYAIKIVGRVGELHKHCPMNLFKDLCFNSESMINGFIGPNGGVIADYTIPPPVYHFYVIKGDNFYSSEPVVEELGSKIKDLLSPYLDSGVNNWSFEIHVVDELPDEIKSVNNKWLMRRVL